MDVKARIRKTGEERVYPEKVFENICDDTDNPLEFIEYVDIPTENQSTPQIQQLPQPEVHSQLLIDEVIRLREENNKLKSLTIEEQPEKKRGRPAKEVAA